MNNAARLTMLILTLSLIFSPAAFAADLENSRLIPENKVTVYKDGKEIGEYTHEMPIPEGALLVTEGSAAFKLDNEAFVADDQSRIAFSTDETNSYLSVQKGMVRFGFTNSTRRLVFLTPEGAVATKQVFINASNGAMLEGYVKVTEKSSEIGVVKGGSVMLTTKDGEQEVSTGQSILLAQAETGSQDRRTPPPAGWWGSLSTVEKVGTVAIAAIGVGGAAYAISEASDDDDDAPASPSSP